MTIRIVLADDEPIILKGLRKLIPWHDMGMDIVAQADDGRELLELIAKESPDIVISDISMPHISGIDMIKEIHRQAHPAKVIFISAYQEFSYAKDALAYGAVDYLVKPLVKEEMERALQKAVALIKKEDEVERNQGKLTLLERRSREVDMREWLEQLTEGTLSPASEPYRILKREFAGSYYSLGIVETDWKKEMGGRWHDQEKKLVDFAIENIISELITACGPGHVFYKASRHVFVVGQHRSEPVLQLADQIRTNISAYLKLEVSIGLGQCAADLMRLPEAYRQARQALDTTYFHESGRIVVFQEERHQKPVGAEEELYALRSKVIRQLLDHSWDDARETTIELMDRIKGYTFGNRSLAVSTCFSSVYSIIQEITNMGVRPEGDRFDMRRLQELLERLDTYPDMVSEVLRIIFQLHEQIHGKASNKEKVSIARVKQYIDEHFAEEITLETAASIAFMNPYYFSSFFKKHMKQNFKQYVTAVRMKHAVHLLASTDLMVYEIAERCGYNNARHFSDMFKKQTGKLPQEYRQSLGRESDRP